MSWNIRRDPFTRRESRHDGIDLPFGMNTSMGSFQDGTVTKIENDPSGYGWYVDVKHDDGTTGRYAHAGVINKAVGHRVKRGEELGLVGSTGRSTGPHVHFEHHDKNGTPMDPRAFLASVGGRPEYPNFGSPSIASGSPSMAGQAPSVTAKPAVAMNYTPRPMSPFAMALALADDKNNPFFKV